MSDQSLEDILKDLTTPDEPKEETTSMPPPRYSGQDIPGRVRVSEKPARPKPAPPPAPEQVIATEVVEKVPEQISQEVSYSNDPIYEEAYRRQSRLPMLTGSQILGMTIFFIVVVWSFYFLWVANRGY